MTTGTVHITSDGTTFVVYRDDLVRWRCSIPVLPGGDGAETEPLEARTERCRHQTPYHVGAAATCPHHLQLVYRLAGIQQIVTDDCEETE